MNRPTCKSCNQRLCAVNYVHNGATHYRSRCDYCIKKGRRIKPAEARWKQTGYKKKPTCDVCGFRAKYAVQLMVYHVDGNLNNNALTNLKTVCHNCSFEVKKTGLTWRPGDLEPDF